EKSIGKVEADIYFHSGKIDASAITLILQTPIVIANSNSAKKEILNKTDVAETKIHVIYPSIKKSNIDIKEAKKDFFEELEIPKKTRIIFFTARTLKTNGIKELFDTLLTLSNDNYKLIIASDKEQITALKFQITKYKLDDKVIFYEDFKNMDLLYAVSDIFVLPTYVKNFSLNILKAMSLKTAVFVSSNNSASELVDIFATMESPRDSNTSFKIDALLREKDDLKLIKKSNYKVAKGFYIEKQIQKLLSILNIT
ncbi:MAG: glycosyltransferase family 4 protein, partial [Campylobacteraceae bacterium]|nr:glycosyltransferase family 4 protein [Campylobacteraceae bacterium]